MSATARILPIMNHTDEAKEELFGFPDTKMDEMRSDLNSMSKIENLAATMFRNKSDLLGQIFLALIKEEHGPLFEQEYCDCPKCGKILKVWNPKAKREVETMAGDFTLYRPYFYCRSCNRGFFPLDEKLGLASSPKQYDIQDTEAWISSELPCKTSQETFERFIGGTRSADHLRQTTNRIAGDPDILDICPTKEEILEIIDEIAKGKFRRPAMMLAIDGAHTPTRSEPSSRKEKRGRGRYKETKGFRLYLIDKPGIVQLVSWHQIREDWELEEKLVVVRDAGLIPEERVRLCVIGDGAPWIWNRALEVFPNAKGVLDRWHCSEYLHAAANEQYGKNTTEARQLVEVCQAWLFLNDADNALAELGSIKPGSEETRKAINKTINYIIKNEGKMNYGAAKRGGYHIAGGAIESANKFVGHTRMKRSGAWWYITCANNMLKLRCAKANGTYDRVIKKFIEADRQSTYGKR